jgi:predicted outer membrane repeat protein
LTLGQGSKFTFNKALNTSLEAFKKSRGSGGALFFECDENSLNCVVDITTASFMNNIAEIKGGAIHWDTIEPFFGGLTSSSNFSSIKFSKNKAGRYGDNISAIPQNIVVINEKDYKNNIYSS